MRRPPIALAALALLASATPSLASEEEFLSWRTLRIECQESPQAGKVAVTATVGDAGLSSFKVSAFGKDYPLAANDLARIRDFPLHTLQITHEAGYPQLGGHTAHFRLKNVSYSASENKTVEEVVIISVSKGKGLSVSGPGRK